MRLRLKHRRHGEKDVPAGMGILDGKGRRGRRTSASRVMKKKDGSLYALLSEVTVSSADWMHLLSTVYALIISGSLTMKMVSV